MTFQQFLDAASTRYNHETSWRMGQTYFNVLHEVRPDLAEKVRGAFLDPFHNDVMVPSFLNFLAAEWEVDHA